MSCAILDEVYDFNTSLAFTTNQALSQLLDNISLQQVC